MKKLPAIFLLIFIGCGQKHINPESVNNITLIQVDHPYIGQKVDSIELNDKLIGAFLNDFADRKEEILKFYSCYVIKIHLKNGDLISYRTDGNAFEKFVDANANASLFKLNSAVNLVTKYWGITADKFCQQKQSYISKIEMHLSAFGVESDNYPSIKVYIDFENDSNNCVKSFYNPAFKGSTYKLSKEEISKVLKLLENSDLNKLKSEYSIGRTDHATSTTIIYTDKKTYIINDYGLRGDYPLQELYNIVYKF